VREEGEGVIDADYVDHLQGGIDATESAADLRLHRYQYLVNRAVEVFGDEAVASLWLSNPCEDLGGRVPLEVASSVAYDEREMIKIFRPLFIRIEHGIYQ
jgi:uncharacterized protein (DUF2384 family)